MIKDKERWGNFKKEFKEEIGDRWFIGYFISMMVLGILLSVKIKSPTINEIIFILFPLVQVLYNIKSKTAKESKNSLRWWFFSFLVIASILYISAINKEIALIVPLFLAMVILIFLGTLILSFKNLFDSKSIKQIIFSYLLFAFVVILLFGFTYALGSGWNQNKIIDNEQKVITNAWDFVYFSSSVFYSNVMGYYPYGISRLITQIESASSFIIHIILLGYVLKRLFDKIDEKKNNLNINK